MSPPAALQLSRPRWLVTAVVASVVVVVGLVTWWFLTHPASLPVQTQRVTATTTVDQPVYLGVFRAPNDLGRVLEIDGVKIRATSSGEVSLVPWVCHGGTPGVTTDPTAFCGDLVEAEGARLEGGDSVVLEVRSEQPTVVVVDRVRIGYREGWQAATQEAGAPALVTVAGR